MKNTIFVTIIIAVMAVIIAAFPQTAEAASQIAGASAHLAGTQAALGTVNKQDNRAKILRAYLQQYNSPLADHAETFVEEADKNQLDWKFVAAISGVESTFGQAIPPYSYNGWGFGVYGNNVRRFSSWDDGISVVSTALREEYMNKRGATNVYQIGATYAASPTWAARVTGFMNDIDAYAARFDTPTVSISL